MRFIKKFLFLSFSFFGLILGGFSFADQDLGTYNEDFLQQAFSPALQSDQVVWRDMIWTTKYSVWHYVLEGGSTFNVWKWVSWSNPWGEKYSLIVQITKFLVRMTLVLAITMIIYNGILFVVKSTKGEMSKETLQKLAYICVGVLLALSSVVIIRLANSVGTTTLKFEDSQISYYSPVPDTWFIS